jgi:16S rRNA (cytosine967-C5)-methyltransferase
MVKIGGKIVYATCSILPSENTLQVQKFLQSNENFQLEEEKIVLPSQGFDGFYMARLVRKS